MFSYRVKHTEFESDIQNNNLFYKIANNAKILSNYWKKTENRKVPKTQLFILYYV